MPIFRAPNHYLLCLCTGLLLGGCSPSAPEADSNAASTAEEGDRGFDEQLSEPLTASTSASLGRLNITVAGATYDLSVHECHVDSLPGKDQGIASFWVQSAAANTADASDQQDDLFSLEFNLQDAPNLPRVMLLNYSNQSETVNYSGNPQAPAADDGYELLIDAQAFDVRTGNREPLPENHATPEQPAEISATFRAAALGLEETTEMLNTTEAQLTGELNATCMLRWRS